MAKEYSKEKIEKALNWKSTPEERIRPKELWKIIMSLPYEKEVLPNDN